MNSKQRVLEAIAHREPDKVPKGELEIAKNLRTKLLDGQTSGDNFKDEVRVRKMLDMDIAPLVYADRPGAEVVEEKTGGRKITRDIWGGRHLHGQDAVREITHAVENIADVYTYQFPPLDIFWTGTIERWVKETDFFVFAQLDGGFNGVYPFFGLTDFLMYSQTNPEEIRSFINRTVDYWIELAGIIVKAKPDGILIGDDMAYNLGTMMSPRSLRELVFPAMKREVKAIKKMADLPVFLHSDGDLNKVLDDIVDIGFDGLQSLQPSAGMDIEKIKSKYGKKLCLWGNVDLNHLLPFGRPEEVAEKVKWLVKTAGKDGGYILSSCNVLTANLPVENVLAMYQTAEGL